MNIIAGSFRGITDTPLDDEIYVRRMGSGCRLLENVYYDKTTKCLVEKQENHYVVDYFDGEYLNCKKLIIRERFFQS